MLLANCLLFVNADAIKVTIAFKYIQLKKNMQLFTKLPFTYSSTHSYLYSVLNAGSIPFVQFVPRDLKQEVVNLTQAILFLFAKYLPCWFVPVNHTFWWGLLKLDYLILLITERFSLLIFLVLVCSCEDNCHENTDLICKYNFSQVNMKDNSPLIKIILKSKTN